MSMFRGTLEFFGEIGMYDVVLPFLLVFTIVYAILEKTRIFGVEEVDGLISIKIIGRSPIAGDVVLGRPIKHPFVIVIIIGIAVGDVVLEDDRTVGIVIRDAGAAIIKSVVVKIRRYRALIDIYAGAVGVVIEIVDDVIPDLVRRDIRTDQQYSVKRVVPGWIAAADNVIGNEA